MMDSLRGVMTPEQELELISVVAFIKNQDEAAFTKLMNVGQSGLLEVFLQTVAELSKDFPDCLGNMNLQIEPVTLKQVLEQISHFDSLEGFSDAYRTIARERFGIRGGENISNENESQLIKALLGNVTDKTLYDGVAGLASTTSALEVKQRYLQDINQQTAQVAARLLTIEGKDFEYQIGNSLEKPLTKPESFDLAVMTPPMGMRLSAVNEIQKQSYLFPELKAKIPTSGADSLWLQLALHSLNATGKAFLTLATGCLFRGGYDAKVREYLIEHELIDTIILLPQGYFSHTGISGAMFILRKDKPKGTPIKLIDASEMGLKARRGVELQSSEIQLVADLYHGKIEAHKCLKSVLLSEIRSNGYDLGFGRYFIKELAQIAINPTAELSKLAELTQKHQQSQQKLNELLSKFDV